MTQLSTTDILLLPAIVVGWLCVAAFGVVWFGTRAYFKSKHRVLDEWNQSNGDGT